MKTTYIFLAVVAILMYNAFLIHRDKQLFDAYNRPIPVEKWNSQKIN